MEDNFYQASTEKLIKPTERQQEKVQQARNAFERERPLITSVMEILEKEIAYREKIDSITKIDDPESFMREITVNKQVCSILRRELNKIKGKVKMYDDKKMR